MAYQAEISRTSPTCFLFLIDQSGSMADPWGGAEGQRKADSLATIMNRLLTEIVLNCTKEEGPRDYFHIGVIGYGSDVGPALGGALAGERLVPVSKLADFPLRVEERTQKVADGIGGLVEQTVRFPVWIDPAAGGGTPMCAALDQGHQMLSAWVAEHQDAFPPVVMNLTDGEATDGDPSGAAARIRGLSTRDGNLLLLNLHLSARRERPIDFPDSDAELPDQYARQLFHTSSLLPPPLQEEARRLGYRISELSRGFMFNANYAELVNFLQIGTRPSNLR